jgi:hypothetical protein
MLSTSVAFLDALSAILSAFCSELTNDGNKTSGTKAWYLVYSIVRWMFGDIAVHRCLASFVDFKRGVTASSDEVYRPIVSWPSLPRTVSDTTLRLRRLSTITCTVIEYRGWCSTNSGRMSVKPFD